MYSPRHARPSCVPARAAVGSTLAAILLPIAVASPAIAQEAPATPTATVQDPVRESTTLRISASVIGSDGTSAVGVRLLAGDDDVAVPDATVDIQALRDGTWARVATLTTNAQGLANGDLPFSASTRIRAVYLGSATRAAGTSPEVLVVKKAVVAMRISATAADAAGRSDVGVRLLADGRPVQNGYIRIERRTSTGWEYVARLLSNSDGLGRGTLSFSRDTRIRATYAGSSTRTAGVSPEVVVKASTLGQQAVQIAAQQAGKPYSYGSAGPSSFDCSGFTTYIYKTRLGRSIPRTSAQQAAELPRVSQSAKRPGDLLFFRSGGRVSHVAVYAGGGQMWDAPTSGNVVRKRAIYSSSYTVGRVG